MPDVVGTARPPGAQSWRWDWQLARAVPGSRRPLLPPARRARARPQRRASPPPRRSAPAARSAASAPTTRWSWPSRTASGAASPRPSARSCCTARASSAAADRPPLTTPRPARLAPYFTADSQARLTAGSPGTVCHGAMSMQLHEPRGAGAADLERALFEVKRVVVGQDRMVERMLVALLARGHCLLEGVPGVAKSLAVETLARVVGGTNVRLQFTPDLVPSDIVGTRVYRPSQERVRRRAGPGVRQPRARRRDQPGAGQGAVGAAGGDGRAAGVARRRHPPAADAVPRARDAEPDRERGRVPAARGAAGPLPAQGGRWATPRWPRRWRSCGGCRSTRRAPSRC